MTQTIYGTERICNYADFRMQSIKPRRTERAQRQEIENSLDLLARQGDYWSIDLIRKAATALSADDDASANLYFFLREVIFAKPGEWIVRQK